MTRRSTARWSLVVAICVVAGLQGTAMSTAVHAAPTQNRVWHVQAGAADGGAGSARSPLNSLPAVERVSRPFDTIVVEPARPHVAALDGGITLKRGQKLIGGGRPVLGAPAGASLPRLTNTTITGTGDAVTLADQAEVRNLVISKPMRSAIYGHDATEVTIAGNDISHTNVRCHDGFLIGPFQIPASIAVRTAVPALPNYIVLNNGWAAVMLDHTRARGDVTVRGNRVHDTACGDGIDIRTFGSSAINATVDDNHISRINLGVAKLSVLAMGLQSKDASSLTATLRGNTQTDIADPARSLLNKTADSEGVFLNPVDQSKMRVTVANNTFRRGDGNFSANGLEYVTTTGSPQSSVTVTDSTFDDVTGDVIESYNLSPDAARHHMSLTRVRATRSHFPAALINPVVPVNLGSCLVATGFGRHSDTALTVADSDFGRCSADGIGVVSYTPRGTAKSTARMRFDIRDTTVDGASAHGINVINVGDPQSITGRLERVTVRNTSTASVNVENHGTPATATFDMGGGPHGSSGSNCLSESRRGRTVTSIGAHMWMRHNWWGHPAGPTAGAITATRGGPDTTAPLPRSPRPECM